MTLAVFARRAFLAGMALVLLLALPLRAEDLKPTAEEGIKFFQAGQLEEAAEIFLDILLEDPEDQEARRNLAHTLAALGERSLRNGRFDESREYLRKAVENWPEEPLFHVLLAILSFQEGDLHDARWETEEALEIDPAHSLGREILGDIFYREGYLNQSISEWEAALAGAGPRQPWIKEKIARARKEYDVEGTFDRQISSHFTFEFDGPVSDEISEMVMDHLEESYERIGAELGHYPMSDIKVILYSRKLFREINQSPEWASGTYDGKIRIPVGGLQYQGQQNQLRAVLAHELTHAFLRSIAPKGLPLWFEEGLAKYFEGMSAEIALRWLKNHSSEPFENFQQINSALRGEGGRVSEAYFCSFLALSTLIDEEGFWSIRQLLQGVGQGMSFNDAFREEMRREPREFEERWLDSLPF